MMTIGITCSHREDELTEIRQQKLEHYRLTLQDAGAASKVLFLPNSPIDDAELNKVATQYAQQISGLVVSGGDDLPPEMYGKNPDPHLGDLVPPMRPALETQLIGLMLAEKKPVLGICYGVQLLNVLEGGTLIQDIPSQRPDAIEHRDGKRHIVHTEPGTLLREWLGERFEVASYHHQSIDQVAPSARLSAIAEDGIIEAIEFPHHEFCVGVQWHPERTRESAATQNLMKKFVDACRKE